MSHLGKVQSQWPSWDPVSHPKRTLMENSGLENKASEISFKSDHLFPAGKWRGSSKSPLLPHYYLSIYLFYHHHYLLTFITCFSHATFVAAVWSLSCVWLFATPRTAARQASMSISPGVCANSCPLSPWYYLTISFSAAPFSFCLPSFPASGSFPMSQLFASSGQSIGASTSAECHLLDCIILFNSHNTKKRV